MKLTIISILFFLATPAFSVVSDPFANWIPKGWRLIAHKTGDLNQDGIDDAVLIAEETNRANFKKNQESLGADVLNLNPRRLIILLNISEGFRKILSRDDLLPNKNDENNPCLADPLKAGGVSISRGNIVVKLESWLSCGSYGITNEKFTFRLEDTRFRLIGYDYSEFHRSIGEQSQASINYLTGKKKITEGLNAFEDSKPKVSWETLPPKRNFYLDEMSLYCDTTNKAHKDNWCQ